MKNKNRLRIFVSFLFLFFLFLTFLVGNNLFNRLDIQVTKFLQNIIPRYLDVPFSSFSLVGSFEIVLLILLILWVKRSKLNYFYVLIFFGLFHVVELLGKIFINHPNPPLEFIRYSIPFSFPTSGVNTGSSFPSGHMGRTAFIAIVFAFTIYYSKRFSRFQKKLLYLLTGAAVVIMFVSRIYLGEHWFSDVVGGGILGSVFGILSLLYI